MSIAPELDNIIEQQHKSLEVVCKRIEELNEENTDLRSACEQKQEIINGSETIRKEQGKELQALEKALREIIVISDRKHDAWDRAKALLEEGK